MNPQRLILFASALLGLASCKSNAVDNGTTPSTGTTPPATGTAAIGLAPVETNRPNSTYSPAFSGQTRVAGVRTTTPFESTILTSALTSPWGLAILPDGRFLVTEKAGTMRLVTTTGQVSTPLSGIPAVNSGGQGGLLGVCVDPAFSTNRMVYWSFSERRSDGNLLAVAKGRLAANETGLEDVTVIYRATPAYSGTNQYGSRLVVDRTGNLFVSSGDRSDPGIRVQAQDVNSAIGKTLRITTNGQPVATTPLFAGSNRAELYSAGHRNPHGLAIHPVTGDLWGCEFGPRGGDEINRIQPGVNYGWPVITYGIEYSGQPVGSGIQQREGLEQPVYYWDPVVSPSGMTFYSGNRIPEWQNNLFVAALSGMHIVRLVIENNRVVGEERLLASEGQRFRDINQGPNGALYAITDGGRLYRIDRR